MHCIDISLHGIVMLFSPLHLQDARGAELNACMKSLINHFLFGGSTPIQLSF